MWNIGTQGRCCHRMQRKLQEKGARNVLVSMAGEGAVLVAEDGSVSATPAPKGKIVNGVGAGDSMVAGFIAGWMEKHEATGTAFHMGVCIRKCQCIFRGIWQQKRENCR